MQTPDVTSAKRVVLPRATKTAEVPPLITDVMVQTPQEVKPADFKTLAALTASSPLPDVKNPELKRYLGSVLGDLDRAVDFLQKAGSPVAVMGSARTKEGTVDEATANALGASLAPINCPVITGGGGAIMLFALKAMKAARDKLRLAGNPLELARTLAVNIALPHEQKLNDAVEFSHTLNEFLFRKWALYHNALGVFVLPGGFGTMDEVTEVWTQAARKQHGARLATVRTEFWHPILKAIHQVAVKDRQLISPSHWNRLEDSNAVSALVNGIMDEKQVRGKQEPVEVTATRMRQDLIDTVAALDNEAQSVTFLGGRGLKDDDPTCAVMRQAAALLTKDGNELRVGNPAAAARAVVEGARQANPQARVQGLMLRGEDVPQLDGLKVVASQSDFIIHKDMLTRHSKAVVAAPGGLGTLANVFAVLTEMQTRKRDKIPMVFVGTNYYAPIFREIKRGMLSDTRQMINIDDLNIVITDDAQVVADAVQGKALPPAGQGSHQRYVMARDL